MHNFNNDLTLLGLCQDGRGWVMKLQAKCNGHEMCRSLFKNTKPKNMKVKVRKHTDATTTDRKVLHKLINSWESHIVYMLARTSKAHCSV